MTQVLDYGKAKTFRADSFTFEGPVAFNQAVALSGGGTFTSGSLAMGTGTVLTFPSVDGSPAPLSFSSSASGVTKSLNSTGAVVATGLFTISFFRLEATTFFYLTPNGVAQNGVAVNTLTMAAAFDAGYRPSFAVTGFPIFFNIAGTVILGIVAIGTNGDIAITKQDGSAFTAGAANTTFAFSCNGMFTSAV